MLKKVLYSLAAVVAALFILVLFSPSEKVSSVTKYIERIENATSSDEVNALCIEAHNKISEEDAKRLLEATKTKSESVEDVTRNGTEHLVAIGLHCQMARERMRDGK